MFNTHKIGRNDPCWCKSGLKYKNCHESFDQKIADYKKHGVPVPRRDMIKTKEQIDGIREAGLINTAALDLVEREIKIGMSTEDINTMVHNFITERGGIPATLNYEGFPKSLCTSLNDEICHGIPDKNVILADGDIINVDITTIYNGYYADASRMFMLGNVKPEVKKFVEVVKECFELGVKAVKPWGRLGDIGDAINTHAKKHGYVVVRDIGGHGVGIKFHEDPYVCHVGKEGTGMLLAPGMVFTVEPMINMGKEEFYVDEKNGWTVYTVDGMPSAQFEVTLAVLEDGIEILTH